MPSSARNGRVRPSEVAADTKRNFIPAVRSNYSERFPPVSHIYRHPATALEVTRRICSTRAPTFLVEATDPVTKAISCAISDTQVSEAQGGPPVRVPFISAANERRPGGDWETGCSGYEEKLCRRSNLSAILGAPSQESGVETYYPIPSDACLFSENVIVYRGPHERYEKLDRWYDIPVISVTPTRWPKLKEKGTKYSFDEERAMIREKIRGALLVCLDRGFDRVVIGDFGLGNGHRNPPQEVAEIWRDVLLFDPVLRGQFVYVSFAFEDPHQSTASVILDEMIKKENKNKARNGEPGTLRASNNLPTDYTIFKHVFSFPEIERVIRQPDPRYGLNMLMSS